MRTDGITTTAIPETRHVPLPTRRTTYQTRPKPRGLDWSKHTAPKVDPDAIARLERLGIVTVEKDIVDERPVKVVTKTKAKVKRGPRKPPRARTHGAGWAKPTFDVAEAWRLYQTGMSTRAVGQQLGVTGQTIRAQLIRAGHTLRDSGTAQTRIDTAEAVRLAGEGLTLSQIAETLDVSPSTVRTHLQRAGVTARDGRQDSRRNANFRPDLDDTTLAAEYEAGATIPELAAKYEAGTRTIRVRLLRSGVQLRDDRARRSGRNQPHRLTDAETADAIARYKAGQTMAEIAAALRRGETTVHRTLTRAGIEIRTSGEAQRGRKGHDNALALRQRMRQHGITAADVRAWATATGRPCPPMGPPPAALVDAYLTEHTNTTRRTA